MIPCILLFITTPLFAYENWEIRGRIDYFEQGLSSRNIGMTMESFKKDAAWQGFLTYPYVEENVAELFNRYSSIQMDRTSLELSPQEQHVISSADYRLQAITLQNIPVALKVSFIFLWEKTEDGWRIIAINPLSLIPADGSVADDIKKIGSAGAGQDFSEAYLFPVADSHVYAYSYAGWYKANWGKYEILGAGWHPSGGEKRAYLKFDLSGTDPGIAKKATLKLFHYHTGGGSSLDIGVYRVIKPWTEGSGVYKPSTIAAPSEISWVNQPLFDPQPVTQFTPGEGVNKWIEVDITPLVQAWLSGTPNNGLMLKPVGNLSGRTPQAQYGFYSREHGDIEKRPALVLSH